MIKVLQTNKAYAPLIGGIETIVTNLSEGLSNRKGVEVQVLSCNPAQSLRVVERQMNGVHVRLAPTFGHVFSLPISPMYFFMLRNLRADVLHIHEPFPLADLSLLASRAIKERCSRIVVSWHSDIIRQKWAMAFYTPLIRWFLDRIDAIVVATPNHIDTSSFLKAYRSKCEVIPYGISLDWTQNSASRSKRVDEIKTEIGSPFLLFVGRLVYYKGLSYLLDALKLIPHGRLVIVGSGPLEFPLRQQVERNGLTERVRIIPHVPEHELHAYYEACDVFVLPSTEPSEGFGIVQVEAMACGKPVVTTDLRTGVTYVNKHGETGLTAPVRNAEALARAIATLLEREDLRISLGKNARERVLREFTLEAMVNKTLALYERLLSVPPTQQHETTGDMRCP